jgi:imidazolonepropionase-like amidohydrolase
VDLAGKSLLPGLFDCHTHVTYSTIDTMRRIQTPFSYRFYQAIHNLEATLRIGITTVRDAGGADLGVKEAVADGLIRGPRMQISLGMISQTGGHGDGWMPSGLDLRLDSHPGVPNTIVDGAEAMRLKVRELVRMGADVIKVAVSGGVLSPRDKPTHAHFRLEELKVLVEEATAAGIWVMAHAQATAGIKNAIRAGIRSIDHGIYLDDEAIEMMLARGTWLVPTLVAPLGVIDAAEAGAAIPEASVAKAHEVAEVHRASFAKAVDAGVKVAMGTDSGVTPHGNNLRELELMVAGGMTPMQAIVATTSSAAELMGLEDELGTIEAGKRADLVVVAGDPLEIEELPGRIEAVYQDGRRVV